MQKYHLNYRGEPAKCTASVRTCPREHFDSLEKAENASHEKLAQELGTTKALKKKKTKPIKVYHGSKHKFEEFSYSAIGQNGTSGGQGFYFTDDPKTANYYGQDGYIYEVDFHGAKALSNERLTISKQDFRSILKNIHKRTGYLENWGDIEFEGEDTVLKRAVDNEYYDGPGANDADLLGSIINSSGDSEGVYRDVYEKYGFDHFEYKREGDEGNIYVATVPEAFTLKEVKETPKSE